MKLRENASISVDLTKYQEQIPNVLKNILLILFFKEIELFPMCIQLSMFETGKCMQCYLVCKYLFFSCKVPFSFNSIPHSTFWKEVTSEFQIPPEWYSWGDSQRNYSRGWAKNRERFREHKLFHLSEGRSKTDLIMVHKYLWRKKNTMCFKGYYYFLYLYHKGNGIKRSTGWRLQLGVPTGEAKLAATQQATGMSGWEKRWPLRRLNLWHWVRLKQVFQNAIQMQVTYSFVYLFYRSNWWGNSMG